MFGLQALSHLGVKTPENPREPLWLSLGPIELALLLLLRPLWLFYRTLGTCYPATLPPSQKCAHKKWGEIVSVHLFAPGWPSDHSYWPLDASG